MNVRSKVAMVGAEFLGTAILTTSAINVARSQIGIGYFVAFSVAITVGFLTLIFNSTSSAHFNPAITIGMWTLRKIKTLQAIVIIAAQMLGGFAAWKLAEYFTGQTLANIAGKTFSWKVLVAEMLGTFVLTFGIAAAVYQKYEGSKLATAVAASMFAGIIVASLAANGALNPALALGNQSWGRAYIFGPIIGSVVGMNLYAMLFAPTKMLVAKTTSTVVSEPKVSVSSSRKPAAKKKATTSRRKK